MPPEQYTKREQIALKAPPALHRWLYRQDRQGRRNQQGSYEQDRRSEGGNRKPLDQDGVRAYRRDYSPEDDPPDRIPSHYQRDVSQRRGAYHPRHGGVDPHWSGHYQYNDPISAQEDPDPDPRIGERRQGRGYPFEGDSLEAQLGGRNRSPGRNFNVQYQQHDSALNGNPAANAPGDGGIRHPDHVTPPRNRRSDSPTETEEVPEAIPGREHRPRNPDDWTRRTPRSRLARAPPGTPSNRQNGPGES